MKNLVGRSQIFPAALHMRSGLCQSFPLLDRTGFALVAHRWHKSTSFAWINGLTFIALTVLQNRGRPDITGKPHLIEILPFLAILWTLTSTLGNLRGIAGWLFFGCPKWRAADYLGVAAGRLLAASEVAAHLFGGKLL